MAEEPQKPAEQVVAGPENPVGDKEAEQNPIAETEPDKPVAEKEPPSQPEPVPEAAEKPATAQAEEVVVVEEEEEVEKPKHQVEKKIAQSSSFKEESNVVSDLPEAQKKALDELKHLIQEALNKHELTAPPPPPPPPPAKEEEKKAPEVVTTEEKKEEVVEEIKKDEVVAEEKKEEVVTEEKKEEIVTEEKKQEEKPGPASEEPKIEEEAGTEPPKEAAVAEEPPKVEAETVTATTAEEKKKEEKKEEKKPAEAAVVSEAVVVTEVVEKVSLVDEDGARTVEAIEETIISVSAPATEQTEEAATSSSTKKEGETETEVEVKVEKEKEKEEEGPAPPPPPPIAPEEVHIWGIPLLADERSDVILLKFLRARDFKVKDAFTMIKNTVRWRKEFGIDALLEEDFENDWDKVVFTHGYDKEGHPVCYNVFGEFDNKELYHKTFSDEEKRQKFIRWRIQFLEKSVRKLDYSPTGISTIVQVNDLKNSPGLTKWEHRQATNQALQLLQDNYPEFVAKQVVINVPWWYLAFYRMISPFLTQRTKSKFVFAGPSKSTETLFKYIAPELLPVQYGGLSREGDHEFTTADPVTEFTIKPATEHFVEFPVSEISHLVWEVRVVGWDVSYGAEFVPSTGEGYTVIVQKSRKIAAADETVISNSFKIGEPGKVLLKIDNQTSKKKKLLYRSKTKPIS